MHRLHIREHIREYGPWRTLRLAMIVAISAGGVALVIRIVIYPDDRRPETTAAGALLVDPNALKHADADEVLAVIRRGMFRSASPVRSTPMADRTIERIRSQLTLQCILNIGGERVAYIDIKGVGLKPCKIGDSVQDLFKVLNINERSIDLSIVDHRTTLSL
jgi:hypothetical protein